ncbi:condensation domain-containing protein [Streptomyces griseus]|uniref:condensation domain-containing protein n=1 Tax=Streptomyces griseus TaxID=1911 RepID=UPI00068CC025|nr:condensation domain-containing protein [Streptomyces griseus]
MVVREGRGTGGKQLVGYVVPAYGIGAGDPDLRAGVDVAEVRRFVAARLPEYMVPAVLVVLDRMPLDLNGKVDRPALPAPEFSAGEYRAPRTPEEQTLAAVYAEVLGLDRVGVEDDFFAIGGDSIRSIQVVARARARGVEISPRQVFESRTVAELAAGARSGAAAVLEELAGGGIGWMPLPPAAAYVMEAGVDIGTFSMSTLLELPDGIDAPGLAATLGAVLDRHDLLRSRLVARNGEHGLVVDPPGALPVGTLIRRVGCDGRWESHAWRETASSELNAAMRRLDPGAGVMAQFVWFDAGPSTSGRLLMVLHHLVVDGVSWRILLPDLAAAWVRVREGVPVELPEVTTSLRRWAHALVEEAASDERVAELAYWQRVLEGPDPAVGNRCPGPAADPVPTVETVGVELPARVTEALLTGLPAAFRGGLNDGLLAALALAVAKWRGTDDTSLLVRLEGHGREEGVVPGADLSRTVGWFTSMFPVRPAAISESPDVTDAGLISRAADRLQLFGPLLRGGHAGGAARPGLDAGAGRG